MDEDLLERTEELKQYQELNAKIGKLMLEVYGGAFYPLDLLAVAVLNRSQALISGFTAMIEAKNLICAAPLVRLQLDNCLRFFASFLVSNPHDFALSVLEGTPVRRLQAKDGEKMTDKYLAEKLNEKHSWVFELYENTSGYIHLSEAHIFNAVKAIGGGKITLKISPKDMDFEDDVYLEAINAFEAATDTLLDYIIGWTVTKANPERIAEIKQELDKLKESN